MIKYFLFCFLLFVGACNRPLNQGNSGFSPEEETYLQVLYDSARALETRDVKVSLDLVYQIQTKIEESNNTDWKSKALNQLGRLYFYSGLLDESTYYYSEALEVLKNQSTITKNNVDALIGLGSISHKINQHEDALAYFTKAFNLLQPDQDFYLMSFGTLHNNIGSVFLLMEELDKADSVLRRGIDFLEVKDPQNSNIPRMYNNLGRVQQVLKNYDQALYYFEKVKNMDESKYDFYRLALDYSYIASVYEEEKNFQKAIKTYRTSFAIADSLGFDVAYFVSSSLSRLYFEEQKTDSAMYFSEISENLLEKFKVTETKKKLVAEEVKAIFELRKQDLDKKIGFFNSGLSLISLLVILGLIFALFYYQRVRKANQKAVLKNLLNRLNLERLEKEKNQVFAEIKKNEEMIVESFNFEQKRNEFLQNFAKKLLEVEPNIKGQSSKYSKDFFKNSGINPEKLFEEFEFLYLNVDEVFFKKLSEKFPNLTNQELRLCGLIRMKLSNEEMAAMTGKSLSTLHVSKSRLRKKLGLENTSQTLEDFVIEQFKN